MRMELGERGLLLIAFALSTALWTAVLYPQPIWASGDTPTGNVYELDNGETEGYKEHVHKHAYLTFVIDGERKNLTREYIHNEGYGHFHSDDQVYHKHAGGVKLKHALESVNVTVTGECLTFALENHSYCADDEHDIGVVVNGAERPVDDALDRLVHQDDEYVVYYGTRSDAGPYTGRTLPEEFRPSNRADE